MDVEAVAANLDRLDTRATEHRNAAEGWLDKPRVEDVMAHALLAIEARLSALVALHLWALTERLEREGVPGA